MTKPDFSNDTKRLAARTQTLRALTVETVEDSESAHPTNNVATAQRESLDKARSQAPRKNQHPLGTTTISPAGARWSNRMASLNTEIPFDMRELIDELYVTRRKTDKREGRKLTTYADLTTEAFELLLQKSRATC